MATHFLGIRHHGPGSARALERALEELNPDVVVLETAPETASVLALAAEDDMRPPVAMLLYEPEVGGRAVYFPVAAFSPEWTALRYAYRRGIPVEPFDLSQGQIFALETQSVAPELFPSAAQILQAAPLDYIAAAAGYPDGESWWNHAFEERRSGGLEVFAAVAELMRGLRETLAIPESPIDQYREAVMRKTLRAVEKKYQNVAVVCGAWHVPALENPPLAKTDVALLKTLPKAVKINVTWIPWSYRRLTFRSGYGAGVDAPVWYDYLYQYGDRATHYWLAAAAALLRTAGMDVSAGHTVEAVYLADTLAALRERPRPGLGELYQAMQTVFCFGAEEPLKLIDETLKIGDVVGGVPLKTPTLPLRADVERLVKKLRIQRSDETRDLDLDLRKENDREKSLLFRRLALLDIPWAKELPRSDRALGTFKETWRVQWRPEYEISIIEANRWGETLETAAHGAVTERLARVEELSTLAQWTGLLLFADMPQALNATLERLSDCAAAATDVVDFLFAIPELTENYRYGDVRKTDVTQIRAVLDSLITRALARLPEACHGLSEEAARAVFTQLSPLDKALYLLNDPAQAADWDDALIRLADGGRVTPLLAGRAARFLFERKRWHAVQVKTAASFALSDEPPVAAEWIEGFLTEGGGMLLRYNAFWTLFNQWLNEIPDDYFIEILPLLRRTFATFDPQIRKKLGDKVRRSVSPAEVIPAAPLDAARALLPLPLLGIILGKN